MDLPADIIEEILSRLAVKPLCRFRCVSKSWRRLIDDPKFIKNHHQTLTKHSTLAHHRVIQSRHPLGPEQYSLNSLLMKYIADSRPFYDPTVSEDVNILGCCNGLLCIMHPQLMIISLWNPATRIIRTLPETPEITLEALAKGWFTGSFGFGYDESSGAHKVFVEISNDDVNKRRFRVYSSDTDSWRTLEGGSGEDLKFIGVERCRAEFVSGKLHWNKSTTTEWRYEKGTVWIVNFDLKREVFGRMEMPCDPKGSYASCLGQVEGRLSMVFGYKTEFDVWVMKEYGVKESWEKVVQVPFLFGTELYPNFPHVSPLWIGGIDGEILLVFDWLFVVYYPRLNSYVLFNKIKGSSSMHLYVESLVSPF